MKTVIKEETLWHVIVLSNFARGYDKYRREYSKRGIPESTFPDRFFLLRQEEIGKGIEKCEKLLTKLGLPGNRILAISTKVSPQHLNPNLRTGIGRFIESDGVFVNGLYWIDNDGSLAPVSTEEAMAASLSLLDKDLQAFKSLKPRTLSVLPIAKGCQAACPFCFSESSVSAEQDQAKLDAADIEQAIAAAKLRGAERFVITGGGEPGLLKHEKLCAFIKVGSEVFGKVILITNGYHLANKSEEEREEMLRDYHQAGLSVLSLSRHHDDNVVSAKIMSLDVNVAAIADSWQKGQADWPGLKLRLICVLQKEGVGSKDNLQKYLNWAGNLGVPEICFKELYISTSVESVYHQHAANLWSDANQVSLALLLSFLEDNGFEQVSELPWGAPIYNGNWKGHTLQIAAYTEPSLIWERMNGIARSWNIMADGRCLVSLEDRASEIEVRKI